MKKEFILGALGTLVFGLGVALLCLERDLHVQMAEPVADVIGTLWFLGLGMAVAATALVFGRREDADTKRFFESK